MQHQLKQLGLTQLEKACPRSMRQPGRSSGPMRHSLHARLRAEIEGRDRRAAERRMTAAHLPTIKTLEAFEFAFQPSLSERLLWELADLSLCADGHQRDFSWPTRHRENALSMLCAHG